MDESISSKLATPDTVCMLYTREADNTPVSKHSASNPVSEEASVNQDEVPAEGPIHDTVSCSVGEKRKLRIPPHLGYGDAGAGADIPGEKNEHTV